MLIERWLKKSEKVWRPFGFEVATHVAAAVIVNLPLAGLAEWISEPCFHSSRVVLFVRHE